MARAFLTEPRREIALAAHAEFLAKGYEQTSYTDIAQASGYDRTRVQYFFPKKEMLFTGFFRQLLRHVYTLTLPSLADPSLNDVEKMFLLTQPYYSFLLWDEEIRRLTLEAVSYRAVTDKILRINENWSFPKLHFPTAQLERIHKEYLVRVGGIYDYLYRAIKEGQAIDPTWTARKNVEAFASSIGSRAAISNQRFVELTFTGSEIEAMLPQLRELLLTDYVVD